MKKIIIEYLYLDLTVCDRCIGTDVVVRSVVDKLRPAFEIAGYELELRMVEMKDIEVARKYRLMTSPTIRVNGMDICESVKESDCGCCGDISGTQVDCRVFTYEGVDYDVPPEAMVAEGILSKAFQKPADDPMPYSMPENLIRFFEGKGSDIPMIRRCC